MDTVNNDITPEAYVAAADAEKALEMASNIIVTSHDEYKSASHDLMLVKKKLNELEAQRKSITQPMHEAKTRVMDFFRKPTDFLKDAEKAIKKALLTYDQEEERKRKEAARLAAIEEEKCQAAAKLEQEKREAEALELAEMAKDEGDDTLAEQILEEATQPIEPAPVVPTPIYNAPKAEGISKRDNWKGECLSLNDLIAAVAAGKASPSLLMANTTAINQMAKATKGNVKIDGIRFYNDPIISSRAG